jgi:hypothetical protein
MQLEQTVSRMDQVAMLTEAPLGPVYSFVPAGAAQHPGDQRVPEMTRRLVDSLKANLAADGDSRSVLLADFCAGGGSQLSAKSFTITCADLSLANPGQEWLAVNQSEAVFIVTATDPISMEDAREKAAWLRAIKRDEACGLLLLETPGGASVHEAEGITGLPVCAVLRKDTDIDQLARWLVQE